MPNQYVNKVVINDQTRIDLTGDTVTADKLMRGYTAHDRSGAPITGTHDDLTAKGLYVAVNGTYTAPAGKAYSPVTVAVPQGIPIDVSTSAGMTAVLTAANAGRAYRFTGTTDSTYTNGDIYVVEVT